MSCQKFNKLQTRVLRQLIIYSVTRLEHFNITVVL